MADFYIHVVIPVYNCKDYLEEAVKSVLKQEYERIEILLIDDGSQDDSSAICDKLAKNSEKITVIHQENYVEIARKLGGKRANSTLTALEKHPLRYAMKNYLIGGASMFVKKITRAGGISAVVERIKYPIQAKNKSAI